MKCERCGHELDNDDLFCSKCGKAVFEEYMYEDDIWEFYKSDEELKAMKMEAAAAAEPSKEETLLAEIRDLLKAQAETGK